MRNSLWPPLALAALLVTIPFARPVAAACDVRREVLEMILAVQRRDEAASAVATQQGLLKSEAVRADIEFNVQHQRSLYLCGTVLMKEGSPEKEITTLITQKAHGAKMILIMGATAVNDPSYQAAHQASLKLIDAAANYFGLKK